MKRDLALCRKLLEEIELTDRVRDANPDIVVHLKSLQDAGLIGGVDFALACTHFGFCVRIERALVPGSKPHLTWKGQEFLNTLRMIDISEGESLKVTPVGAA